MAKINFLTQRFKSASEKLSKMSSLAEMSSSGKLSSFAGVFRVSALSDVEKDALHSLLTHFRATEESSVEDLQRLSALTAEVKAINNQAAILHGERIKKVQEILKSYREGAFSAWMIAAYGNRQTPYNFLQYYEMHLALSPDLHPKLETMPRHAVYILASRSGPMEKKEEIVQNYNGETKQELIAQIRATFPLNEKDMRANSLPEQALALLMRLENMVKQSPFRPTSLQRQKLLSLLSSLEKALHE